MLKRFFSFLSFLFLSSLKWFSYWIVAVFRNLQNNFISVIAILISYFLVWNINQVQDLLLILNQKEKYFNGTQVPLFFIGLMVAAFLIWHAPKYLKSWNYNSISFKNLLFTIPDRFIEINSRSNSTKGKIEQHIELNMPRLLGASFILVYAFGILNAMQEIGLYYAKNIFQKPNVLFILSQGFLFLLLIYDVYHGLRRVLIIRYIRGPVLSLLLTSILGLIFYFGFKNTEGQNDLYFLFLSTLMLAIYFHIFSLTKWENLNTVFLSRIFYRGFILVSFGSFLIFCVVNIYTNLAQYINPISIFIFGIISYIIVGYLILMFGKKHNLALLSIIVSGIILLSIRHQTTNRFKHYEIKLSNSEKNDQRIDIESYLRSWIKLRENDIKIRHKVFPIYLVASEGGGSKAATWVNLVNNYLEDRSNIYFDKHLLLLSGASDGTLGNSLFFDTEVESLKEKTKPKSIFVIGTNTGQMFKNNFLSSSLSSLMGRDLMQSILGVSISKNRAEVLESEWENAAAKAYKIDNILKHDFLSYYWEYPEGKLPLLFVNTTRVQDGNLTIVSPVKLNSNVYFDDIQDFYSNYVACKKNIPSLKLSTAISLGSRYPILNPAAEIKDCYQYVDAGYFDNYGLVSTERVKSLLKKILAKDFPTLKDKVFIKTLIIKNSTVEKVKLNKTEPQLMATVLTFFRTKQSNQSERIKDVEDKLIIQLKPVPVSIGEDKKTVTPIIPLGRFLSGIAVKSIERNFTDNQELIHNLEGIINEMKDE